MSSPPPTKPPRGVKQGKETSGLLMSVIRTLSASETNEQREKERAKLEKEYKKSDARLDELVAAHAQEIMEVMQKFTAVSQSLASWGQHCDAASARLTACRSLLRLRRDDLKRLWMTARTHHYALQMLTDIERVVVSERQARELITAGRVVGAAHTLSGALTAAPVHVTALSATTVQLQIMKQNLVDTVVSKMSAAVYRGAGGERGARRACARRRAALLLAELAGGQPAACLQDITPEHEACLADEDRTFDTSIMISLEALGVLEQLQQATEKVKVNIQNELLEVIDIMSRRVIEEGDVEPEREQDGDIGQVEGVSETGRPLAKLVTILVEEFKAIAGRNKRLLQLWRAALQKYKLSDLCLHTEQHYWSAVQQVMQLLITEYLDIESVQAGGARAAGAGAHFADTLRLSDYFAKKRPVRRRTQLFKLAAAPPRAAGAPRVTPRARVCAAAPAHLPHLLHSVHDLCSHIEVISCVSECSLRAFVTDYVRTGESERLAREARAAVDAALRAPGAWRERAAPPPPPERPGSRHLVIFTCCVASWHSIAAAAAAARACGALGGAAALRGALAGAAALAAGAAASAGGATGAGAARRGAAAGRAARWLADDDIVRFLQALPNWRAAVSHHDKPSQQELQQAYEREAEILGSSLGDGAIARTEIIASTDTLIDLAVHCESMEWISSRIRDIPGLVSGGGPGGGLKLSDKLQSDINSAAVIFDDIAHKCLLLLHLEMRISCFHYLGCVADTEAAEGGAGQLAAALLAFHERAHAVLAPHRLQYILHGIGEMMSAGVVWGWRVGATPRLAPLRHCLAALRVPATGLRHADRYLGLLDVDPQEIITTVRDKGAQFTELEYLNAFKIIGSKRGISQSDMKQYFKQLSAALGHVGVTV